MKYIFLINKKSVQHFSLQFKKHLHFAKCQVKEIYGKKISNPKLLSLHDTNSNRNTITN